MEEPLMTSHEVAKMLRVSLNTLRRYVKDDLLKTQRIGRRMRFRPADVDAFLNRETADAK